MTRLARPGTAVIDVGANVGQFSHLLAARVGPLGIVLAFEPNPAAYRELCFATSRVRVVCVPVALGSSPANATLSVPLAKDGSPLVQLGSLRPHSSDNATEYPVEVRTLDDYLGLLPVPVSLLKIDVEGLESEVLQGAKQLISTFRPPIIFESEHRHQRPGHDASEPIYFLEAAGYQVRGITPTGLTSWRSALDAQARFICNEQSGTYVNNFLATYKDGSAGAGRGGSPHVTQRT